MDNAINRALNACVSGFSLSGSDGKPADSDFLPALAGVFDSGQAFMDKVAALDRTIDDHPRYAGLREILFDLLLMNFFAADAAKLEEDYLETEEWEAIEEQTIDRGTELLNLLLYLRECMDEGIEPELDDYLREFLLVDEDEFQDEYRIYEPVIAGQILVESSYGEIAKTAKTLPGDEELAELFYPMLSFFYEQQPDPAALEEFKANAPDPAFDLAVYQLIIQYHQ